MKLTKPGELRSFAAYPWCWADCRGSDETASEPWLSVLAALAQFTARTRTREPRLSARMPWSLIRKDRLAVTGPRFLRASCKVAALCPTSPSPMLHRRAGASREQRLLHAAQRHAASTRLADLREFAWLTARLFVGRTVQAFKCRGRSRRCARACSLELDSPRHARRDQRSDRA